ncbi:flagellar hook-length control protein FliK [Halanaerobium salsuginis]|jgi:hypothetical protein|uniref:Hook-length control protein FliK n=1 Tax=Halanaerobium salsuginis TaxID=29563 RepID=A0A1I4MJY5_9FIRM|nr:flagellar hook-length control protein FliK [Halanaerobium salsuginis]SFM03337.1 hook-length control protein FliK [Halanaerobium salsuginis]
MDLSSLAPVRKMDIGILRQALNTDNLTTDEKEVQNKETQLLPEIFRLLASLEDDTQKMLLDSWAKLEMPLTEKTVSNLLQYLNQNPATSSEDKMAIIKAFAFLESNGLPFSNKLVDALRSIFNNNSSLSSLLEDFITTNQNITENQLEQLLGGLELKELKTSLTKIANQQINNNEQPNPTIEQNITSKNNQLTDSQLVNSTGQQNTGQSDLPNQLILNDLNSFNNLDSEFKSLILDNLTNLTKNFDLGTIKILNEYLNNNQITGTEEKTALLKAAVFLQDNQLPLTENLLKNLSSLFSNPDTQQKIIDLNNKSDVLQQVKIEQQSLISNRESSLNPELSAEKLAESIQAKSKINDQLLTLFNKLSGETEDRLTANLLGQKLINLQQLSQNAPLLALEIPVQLSNNKLSSLMLKIEADEKETQQEKSRLDKGFKISFIMEFEKIGAIQSNISIQGKTINSTFFTDSAQTAQLIQANFSSLKDNLTNKGFEIKTVKIKNFSNPEQQKHNFFNQLILSELNDSGSNGKYIHLDLKV